MALNPKVVNLGTGLDTGDGDLSRDAFGKVNDNFSDVAAILNVSRLVYWVYGDSTDGGTTPDATTQASIDALVALGIAEANIRWLYEAGVGGNTFTIAPMTSAVAMDGITLTRAGGTLSVDAMNSAVTFDEITLSRQGEFAIDPMGVSVAMDGVTLAFGGGEFAIDAMTSSVAMDNVTITESVVGGIAQYLLDESAGTTATDSLSNLPDMDVHGTGNNPTIVTGLESGNARDFDGTDMMLVTGSTVGWSGYSGDGFRVRAVFRADSAIPTFPGWRTIVGNYHGAGGASSGAWYMSLKKGTTNDHIVVFRMKTDTGGDYTVEVDTSAADVGATCDAEATWDGSTLKLFINDTEQDSGSLSGNYPKGSAAVCEISVGGSYESGTSVKEEFNGVIDHVIINEY